MVALLRLPYRAYLYTTNVEYNYETVWNTRQDFSRQPNGQYGHDIRTAALHEHGHVMGLGHSQLDSAVMEVFGGNPEKITIQGDDWNGLTEIYAAGL